MLTGAAPTPVTGSLRQELEQRHVGHVVAEPGPGGDPNRPVVSAYAQSVNRHGVGAWPTRHTGSSW